MTFTFTIPWSLMYFVAIVVVGLLILLAIIGAIFLFSIKDGIYPWK